MRSQTVMGENWDALFIAIVSERYLTMEQAFLALERGGLKEVKEKKVETRGRIASLIDIEKVLELKQSMTWEEVGKAMCIKGRTLERKVNKYVREMFETGIEIKIPKQSGRPRSDLRLEEAFKLHEEMTWRQVADAMGINFKTLKKRVDKYRAEYQKDIKSNPGRSCKVNETHIKKAIEIKESMTWQQVGETLGVNHRTLKKRVLAYKKMQRNNGASLNSI